MNGVITKFVIHFHNGHKMRGDAAQLSRLRPYLHYPSSVRKIVFWIACIDRDPHYPYRGRSISLLSTPYGFQFDFYYWYNAKNQRVEYSKEHRRTDVLCLVSYLSELPSFSETIFPKLIDPGVI